MQKFLDAIDERVLVCDGADVLRPFDIGSDAAGV